MEFTVSPAGFIVGSGSPFPAANASNTVALSGTKLGIGIPVQSQISLADAEGTWNSVEWNQLKVNPSYPASHPFTNGFSKFVVSAPSGSQATGQLFACDGGTTCSNSATNLTVTKCATCNDQGGSAINNVFTVTDGSSLNLKVALFRAPNKDLIGVLVGSSSTADVISGVTLRTAAGTTLPPSGKVVNNPQWKLDYSNSTQSLTETPQVYSVSNITAATNSSPASLLMTYTDTQDSGKAQTVKMDYPRTGMVYRAATGNTNINQPMVGIKGNGWAISGGTTLASDYPNVTSGTGRFFSVNIKF
jgi:hypothetical protein